ncbi:GIY-YIG nuclease family protein [Candidatus Woesebacteria bacterium]|nr:GIY-YIG nuclease family protein [Candidatus Woesebacteria bacterium]
MPCVYIIKSDKNNRCYIGSTTDIIRRLDEHNIGKTPSTRYLGPWKIVFTQEFDLLSDARRMERKLKSFKSRKIIDRIVTTGILNLKV